MLTLRAGENAVVVAPETGGGIVGWMAGGTPILRRAVPGAVVAGNPHVLGCFPLLPYANRIAGGRFAWRGVSHRLAPNFGDNPHTIHGTGWQRRWSIEAVTDSITEARARLAVEHPGDAAWPFRFRATLDYTVAPDAVTVGMAIINLAPGPAPAGLGLHPYFPKAFDPALRFAATGVWRNGADMLPLAHDPVPADWRFDDSAAVTPMRLDNCFTGWDGRAEIVAGPASLRLEASGAFANLQVFTPEWGDFFCVEPVSHVPDALNRPDLPEGQAMTTLAPGESLVGTIRFSVPEGR